MIQSPESRGMTNKYNKNYLFLNGFIRFCLIFHSIKSNGSTNNKLRIICIYIIYIISNAYKSRPYTPVQYKNCIDGMKNCKQKKQKHEMDEN